MDKCVVCGNSVSKDVFKWGDASGSAGSLKRCPDCGIMYRYPLPHDLDAGSSYDEDYFKDYLSYYSDFRNEQYARYMDMLEKISGKKERVLDVGCAFGGFLDLAHKRGWEIEGFDISRHAGKKAKELYGIDIKVGSSLGKSGFSKGSFDLITMWDVLEHVPRPEDMLKDAKELLKTGGKIIIKVPSADELFMKIVRGIYLLTGDRFIGIGPRFEHHLYLFSRKALGLFLGKNGFRIKRMIMDAEDLVIDDRGTLDSFIKAAVKRVLKLVEKLIPRYRSSIVVIAEKSDA